MPSPRFFVLIYLLRLGTPPLSIFMVRNVLIPRAMTGIEKNEVSRRTIHEGALLIVCQQISLLIGVEY